MLAVLVLHVCYGSLGKLSSFGQTLRSTDQRQIQISANHRVMYDKMTRQLFLAAMVLVLAQILLPNQDHHVVVTREPTLVSQSPF